MAVKPSAGRRPWRRLTPRGPALLMAAALAAGLAPLAQAAETAPAAPETAPAPAAPEVPAPPAAPAAPAPEAAPVAAAGADEYLPAARACVGELDMLRPPAEGNADRVAVILKKGLASLDRADAALQKEIEALAPDKKPLRGTADKRLAADLARLRSAACRVALARGDLYKSAAAALPAGHGARDAYVADALGVYRSLRVAYHDIAPGLMGYLGEAAVQRLAGDAAAARAVVQTVLQIPDDPKAPVVAELKRLALLEDLEAQLLADPAKAAAAAEALRAGKAYKDRPEWEGRADYVSARALAAQAEALAADGPDAPRRADLLRRAAALLRRDDVAAAAPAYDRLAALVHIEALAGEPLLVRDELLGWADLLSAAGRDEAVAFYDRARDLSGEPLGHRQSLAYVALAMRQGRWTDVADACDRLLQELPAADPDRPAALQWRAAALVKVLGAAEADRRRDLAPRAAAALEAVVESAAPAPVRRDALRQWVAAESERRGLAACVDRLDAHPDLVAGDPYLLYGRAAGAYQRTADQWAEGALAEAEAKVRARGIAADLGTLGPVADAAGDRGVAARAALLRATILARPPVRDADGALAVLRAAEAELKADPAVAGAAAWARVEVLLDLGLTEEAFKALAEVPEGFGEGSPVARLRLAEALAARYADIAAAGRAEVQRRVLGLCDAAMAQAAGDDRSAGVTVRAARALLGVGAAADARRVLEKALESEKVRGDPRRLEECSLLMAEAYRRGGQLNQAAGLLDPLAARFPQSIGVHLARGRCRMDLAQPARAAESFRAARDLARPGREDWCRATLALVEALAAGDHAAAAGDILRVAEALYPDFGNPELRGQMRRLRRRLETRTPGEPVRPPQPKG